MAPEPARRVTRLRSFDSLRGLAALAVVLFHLTSEFDQRFPGYPKALISFSGGRYGVQLFFVISGFVILWTVGRASRWRDFGASRFTRLYPTYWASLALAAIWITLADSQPLSFTMPQLIANLTMIPQWLGFEPIDGVYWTLAIEMGFYILVSFLFVARLLRRDRLVFVLSAIWFLDIVVVTLLVKASGGSVSDNQTYTYLFLSGMASFLLWEGVVRPRWLLWALFLQAPFVDLLRGQYVASGVTVVILIVVHLAVSERLAFLETGPFIYLGTISFSLYLVHLTGGYLTQSWLLEQGLGRNLALLLTLALVFLLAVLFNQLFEQRLSTWLRHRMSPRPRPPA